MDLSFIQSILRRVGIRHLPGICWYPAKRTSFIVNSRWHRGELRLFVLDRSNILSRTFLVNKEVQWSLQVCMLACKLANEHWTAQHKARIVAAQAAEKP